MSVPLSLRVRRLALVLLTLPPAFVLVLFDPQACPALFTVLSQPYSKFTHFLVIDLRGAVICSTEAGFIVEDDQLRREIA